LLFFNEEIPKVQIDQLFAEYVVQFGILNLGLYYLNALLVFQWDQRFFGIGLGLTGKCGILVWVVVIPFHGFYQTHYYLLGSFKRDNASCKY